MAASNTLNWTPEEVARVLADRRGASGSFATPGATGNFGAVDPSQPINVASTPLPAQSQMSPAIAKLMAGMRGVAPVVPAASGTDTRPWGVQFGENLNRVIGVGIGTYAARVGARVAPVVDVARGYYGSGTAVPSVPVAPTKSAIGVGGLRSDAGTWADTSPEYGASPASPAGEPLAAGRGTVNVIPAADMANVMSAPDPQVSRALSEARQAAADRGDFGALATSYQANGGTWQGRTAAQDAEAKATADIMDRVRNAKTIPQLHYATQMADVMEQSRARLAAVKEAAAGRRYVADTASADRQQKMWDALYSPQASHAGAQANEINARLIAAANEPDRARRDLLLGARPGPQPHALQFPLGLQPMPGSKEGDYAVAVNPNPGAVGAMRVPIAPVTKTVTWAAARADPKSKGKSDTEIQAEAARSNIILTGR